MGVAILVLGKSGSGKSTSLRNFKPRHIIDHMHDELVVKKVIESAVN